MRYSTNRKEAKAFERGLNIGRLEAAKELAAAEERGRRAGIEEALAVMRGFTRIEVAEVAVRELLAPRDSGKEAK